MYAYFKYQKYPPGIKLVKRHKAIKQLCESVRKRRRQEGKMEDHLSSSEFLDRLGEGLSKWKCGGGATFGVTTEAKPTPSPGGTRINTKI